MPGLGWVAAVIIGGIAGYLADKIMDSGMGMVANVVLGIFGAMLMNFLLMMVMGWTLGGWFGQLLAGVAGACILLFVARLLRRTS